MVNEPNLNQDQHQNHEAVKDKSEGVEKRVINDQNTNDQDDRCTDPHHLLTGIGSHIEEAGMIFRTIHSGIDIQPAHRYATKIKQQRKPVNVL